MSFINNRTMHDRRHGDLSVAHRIMARTTAGEVESSTGGLLVSGPRNTPVSRISIDSRAIQPGDLFFAIRGPRNDGHQFITAALAGGACGAVVDFSYDLVAPFPEDRILLRVENTHQALKDLATDVRRQWRGSLVAITGSVGKTTTKEFAAHVLETEYSVYRSPGNYNNLFGLPLSIFGLSPDDHIGVFEMGMSAPGEIAEMCRIARPDAGILTNVAPVHLEFFNSVEEIARAKGELAEALQSHGAFIYNRDDPLVRRIAERFSGPKISFGLSADADVGAGDVEIAGLYETRFRVSSAGVTLKAMLPMAGIHYVINALPAIALGQHYRIALEQIIESLRDLRQAPMRGQVLRLRGEITVIDDSYNSNPRALTQMIETLAKLRPAGRRFLVAGEMLELGSDSKTLHYGCGTHAAQCGIDLLVAVQGDAEELARGALESGMPQTSVRFVPDAESAAPVVLEAVEPGDLLLVKASRGVHLEKVIRALKTQHPEGQD